MNKTLMKKRLWALIIGIVILAIPFLFGSCANENYHPTVKSKYTINSLNFDCNVLKNGSADIVYDVNITMKEDEAMREMLISIPYYGKLYSSEDGKLTIREYSAKVSNFKLVDSSENVVIKEYNDSNDEDCPINCVMVGLKKTTGYFLGGETYSFKFSYNYKMNNQKVNNLDELYLNLVGTNSSMKINNVSFNITFPEDIDFATYVPAIYYGEVGGAQKYTDFITTSNSISSNTPINLKPYESLTLRQFAPEGYFEYEEISRAPITIAIVLTIVGLLLIVGVKLLGAQLLEVPSPAELIAPKDILPNEAEFVVKYKVSNKVFGASIVWLASHGYIKIEETEKATYLTKIKDADANLDVNLQTLLNSLRDDGEKTNIENLASIDVSRAVLKLKKSPSSKYEDEMYSKKSTRVMNISLVLMLCFILFNVFMLYLEIKNYVGFARAESEPLRWLVGGKTILILNLVLLATWFINLKPKYNYTAAIGQEFVTKRGRMLGLKRYIKMVEEPQLKMFVKENPSLFYDILPYAYVLDVSNVWINKFKYIEIENPTWYSGNEVLGAYWFTTFSARSSSVMSRADFKAFSSNVSSGSSFGGSGGGASFGGGGGFSGGGGGGASFGGR